MSDPVEHDALSPADLAPDELAAAHEGPALGSDPFLAPAGPDPFITRLDELGWESAARQLAATVAPRPLPATPPRPARRPLCEVGEPAPRPRRAPVPPLADVELRDADGLIDRLLSEDERRRLAALAHLADGDYDRFGLAPTVLRRSLPAFLALYRWYFRVRSEGHAHLPSDGPALLVGNHAGLLPFDGAMTAVDVFLHTDPPRLARAVVDRWAGTLPWVNVFYARVGQVIGTRENLSDLLSDGQLALVFPEGIEGVRKRVTQRYRLQPFHRGFVEHALRARAPIVPVAILGSENQAPILFDVKPLARRLGLPVAPITPTFPWLGPLGLLPYPVSYRIVYGEPLRFHERFGPEGADEPRLVRYLANHVRRAVQLLVDRNR